MQRVGNATLKEFDNYITVEIPFQKYWIEIIFYSILMIIMSLIITTLITLLIGILFKLEFIKDINLKGILFIIIFFISAFLMGYKLLKDWLWSIHGRELITFNKDYIIIDRKGTIFNKRIYDFKKIDKFSLIHKDKRTRYNMEYTFGRRGVYKIESENKVIKFASGISEDEGKIIFDYIKSKIKN